VQQIKFELASCSGTLDTGTLSTAAPAGCGTAAAACAACAAAQSHAGPCPLLRLVFPSTLYLSALLSSDVTRVLKKKYFFESWQGLLSRGCWLKADNEVTGEIRD